MTFVAGQVLTAAEMNDLLAATVPTGGVMSYISNTAPTGWLLCDGAAVSRTTYADLFTIIGTTYGAGNGTTTFNVPNLKGRVPVGRDSAQTEFDALAETGGSKTHTLTSSEMPAHIHSHAHTHVVAGRTVNVSTGAGATALAVSGGSVALTGSGAADPGNDTTSTGGGGAHNNLQPYLVLNYIIKI